MGPSGTYHILSKGGVDRGGVTSHLPTGTPAHWLPYVASDDVDATVAPGGDPRERVGAEKGGRARKIERVG